MNIAKINCLARKLANMIIYAPFESTAQAVANEINEKCFSSTEKQNIIKKIEVLLQDEKLPCALISAHGLAQRTYHVGRIKNSRNRTVSMGMVTVSLGKRGINRRETGVSRGKGRIGKGSGAGFGGGGAASAGYGLILGADNTQFEELIRMIKQLTGSTTPIKLS